MGQQNIDLFGIGPKVELAQQRIALSELAYDLSRLEVKQKVQKAWSDAYWAKQSYGLYRELDSIYDTFSKAMALNYEVEAISQLEHTSALNQALQIKNQFQQAERDYAMALQRLNVWLFSDTFYAVPLNPAPEIEFAEMLPGPLENHPMVNMVDKRIDESEALAKAARAGLLPKLNLQGGLQQINGQRGFYSYQAGISIPLLSGDRGEVRAAQIQRKMVEQEVGLALRKLESDYEQAQLDYQKWRETWSFYQDKAIPLAKDQRKGALLAYREGALDYAGFAQIMQSAINTEIKALDALKNYLQSIFELQYFINE